MNGRQVRRELLLHLSVHEWKYGAELREEIKKKTDQEVHQPQVYSGLVKLEALGLIESKVETAVSGSHRRLYRKKVGGKKAKSKFSIRDFFGLRLDPA